MLLGALRHGVTLFNAEGTGAALATVTTLATVCLVLPTFTTAEPGPEFSPAQLTFAAIASLALYGMFVLTQTVRHRDFFLPVVPERGADEVEEHAPPPSGRAAATSLGLLVVALVAVVGLAKVLSPAIEAGVDAVGFPPSTHGTSSTPNGRKCRSLRVGRGAGRATRTTPPRRWPTMLRRRASLRPRR